MTTDPFTTAASAEAERRNPPIDRYPDDFTYPRSVLREHKRGEFEVGAEWARDHLAAQEPQVTLHREDGKPTTCEVRRGGVLIFAGRDYSSDIQVTQGPTDAEVEAAAIMLCASAHHERVWESLAKVAPIEQARLRIDARAALTAAKEARHGD